MSQCVKLKLKCNREYFLTLKNIMLNMPNHHTKATSSRGGMFFSCHSIRVFFMRLFMRCSRRILSKLVNASIFPLTATINTFRSDFEVKAKVQKIPVKAALQPFVQSLKFTSELATQYGNHNSYSTHLRIKKSPAFLSSYFGINGYQQPNKQEKKARKIPAVSH